MSDFPKPLHGIHEAVRRCEVMNKALGLPRLAKTMRPICIGKHHYPNGLDTVKVWGWQGQQLFVTPPDYKTKKKSWVIQTEDIREYL